MRCGACLILLCLSQSLLDAGDIQLFPPSVHLQGSGATQHVLAVRMQGAHALEDVSNAVSLTSSHPDIVRIVDGRWLQAVGDGQARITIQNASAKHAEIQVIVSGTNLHISPSFARDVIPLFSRIGCNSGACHGALAGKGGLKLSLRGFDPESDHFVLTRQANGRRVDFRHANHSLLLAKPGGMLKHGGGQKFDIHSMEFELLKRWIEAGAPGPLAHEAPIIDLRIFPPSARLSTGGKLPTVVVATYSDGHTADVTRWVRFGSSQDDVLRVDDDGLVTVQGPGAAAVTVWYSNHVATMNVLSPFGDQPIAGSLPENNYIDRRVNQRLRELQLPASGTCSDREFIRRLYLDLLGILPSPQEVQEFISDASENRRQRLVERLLERPEFVDYWTYYWSDLLLISTKKLPASNVWAFSRFVRRAVAENWPWDRVARQILTAQGSNLENGAGNYFVMHKDISELTETTAVTFLGISMTCARCHNHPLEKWTQDQYWSLANVFGRLGMKNGERANEVIVQPLQEGDVLHLRRGMAMPPAPLDGPSLPPGDRQDRRMHFANWLTNPRNPYFAKALVNRVWRNFMGRGLIEAEDDLRQTNPPSNPELLQALELDFTRHGFDIKHLIRGIVNSAAYQRSAQTVAGNEKDDRFYSHYLVRRLKAEVLLDAYSQVTRAPTPFTQLESGGRDSTSPTSDYPLGTRALQLADTKVVSRFLTSFGRPERDQACSCERASEATVSQALHLNNGQTLNDKLRSNNSIAHQWIQQTTSDESAILELFRSALSREPTIKEKSAFSALLHDAAKNPTARREALEDMVWAVLSSREFVFNH